MADVEGFDPALENLIDELYELSEHDRLIVFAHFCTECGGDNPACQCWNDE